MSRCSTGSRGKIFGHMIPPALLYYTLVCSTCLDVRGVKERPHRLVRLPVTFPWIRTSFFQARFFSLNIQVTSDIQFGLLQQIYPTEEVITCLRLLSSKLQNKSSISMQFSSSCLYPIKLDGGSCRFSKPSEHFYLLLLPPPMFWSPICHIRTPMNKTLARLR